MLRAPAPDRAPSTFTARPVFDAELLSIHHVVAHAAGDALTQTHELPRHTVVLPYSGVFATHFGRRDSVVTSPNHALLLSACVPHRYGAAGAIGDGALARLLETDLDLGTIALDAGFATHSHFTARFRARFGVTPSAVRRERPR